MSVEECFRLAEGKKKASGFLFGGETVEVTLNQGRVYVDAYGQTTSKLFWTDTRARKYFEKLVEKYGLEVQSSAPKVNKDGN